MNNLIKSTNNQLLKQAPTKPLLFQKKDHYASNNCLDDDLQLIYQSKTQMRKLMKAQKRRSVASQCRDGQKKRIVQLTTESFNRELRSHLKQKLQHLEKGGTTIRYIDSKVKAISELERAQIKATGPTGHDTPATSMTLDLRRNQNLTRPQSHLQQLYSNVQPNENDQQFQVYILPDQNEYNSGIKSQQMIGSEQSKSEHSFKRKRQRPQSVNSSGSAMNKYHMQHKSLEAEQYYLKKHNQVNQHIHQKYDNINAQNQRGLDKNRQSAQSLDAHRINASGGVFGFNHSASEVYQLNTSKSKRYGNNVFDSGYISNSLRVSHSGNKSSGAGQTYQTSIIRPKEAGIEAQVLLGFNLKSHSIQSMAQQLERKKDEIKVLKEQSSMFRDIIEEQKQAPLSQQRMQDLKIVGIQIEDAFDSADNSDRNIENRKSPKTLKRRKKKDLIAMQNTKSCGTNQGNKLQQNDNISAQKEETVYIETLPGCIRSEKAKIQASVLPIDKDSRSSNAAGKESFEKYSQQRPEPNTKIACKMNNFTFTNENSQYSVRNGDQKQAKTAGNQEDSARVKQTDDLDDYREQDGSPGLKVKHNEQLLTDNLFQNASISSAEQVPKSKNILPHSVQELADIDLLNGLKGQLPKPDETRQRQQEPKGIDHVFQKQEGIANSMSETALQSSVRTQKLEKNKSPLNLTLDREPVLKMRINVRQKKKDLQEEDSDEQFEINSVSQDIRLQEAKYEKLHKGDRKFKELQNFRKGKRHEIREKREERNQYEDDEQNNEPYVHRPNSRPTANVNTSVRSLNSKQAIVQTISVSTGKIQNNHNHHASQREYQNMFQNSEKLIQGNSNNAKHRRSNTDHVQDGQDQQQQGHNQSQKLLTSSQIPPARSLSKPRPQTGVKRPDRKGLQSQSFSNPYLNQQKRSSGGRHQHDSLGQTKEITVAKPSQNKSKQKAGQISSDQLRKPEQTAGAAKQNQVIDFKRKQQIPMDGIFQILIPSFQKPTDLKKLVKKPNYVPLKYSDLKSVGETSVQAFCEIKLPFTPEKYKPANLKVQLMILTMQLGLLSRFNQTDLVNLKAKDCSDSSDHDGGTHEIDKLQALRALCKHDSMQVQFDLPISFTIRQRVAPKKDYKIKKETQVEELNNFRAQKIDIYLTSDPDRAPSQKNHQIHKAIQFTSTCCSGEFLANPVYQFSVDFKSQKKLSDSIYMLILGSKACELEILAQPTLIRESTRPFSILDKKASRPVDYDAQRKAEIELKEYLEENNKAEQTKYLDNFTNFIEKNKELTGIRGDPYYVRYHKSMMKQEEQHMRHYMAQQRKLQMESMKLQEAEEKKGRWDRCREERARQLQMGDQLLKRTKRVKLWVGLAVQMRVLHKLVENVDLWKERNKKRMASMFMSVRIKIAFRRRFYRQYGTDFDTRQRRYIQRVLTLTGALSSGHNAFHHRAKDSILFILYRTFFVEENTRRFKAFLEKAEHLQHMIRARKQISVLRRVEQRTKFDKELKYVVCVYQKLQNEVLNKNKKRKGNKSPTTSSRSHKGTLQKLKKLQDSIDSENIDEGGINNKNYLIDQLCKRMSAIYLLDYQIWLFLKNNELLGKVHTLEKKTIVEKNAIRTKLLQRQSRCMSQMKGSISRIYQYEEVLFSNTGNVDRDGLYIIDPAYSEQKDNEFGAPGSLDAKSSPSKVTKQSSSSPTKSSPSPSRKAKSPVKVLKLSNCNAQQKSTTFVKFETQSKLVALLIENHQREYEGLSPTNHSAQMTPEAEAELLGPYRQQGFLAFPPFVLTVSREDMQRLVCKCAGVGQDHELGIQRREMDSSPEHMQEHQLPRLG